jgi:hypothetical protein
MSAQDGDPSIYASELRALMSATEQFAEVTRVMHERGHDRMVRELLTHCGADHLAHQEALTTLLREADPRTPLESCEGMQWLVRDVVRRLEKAAHHGGAALDLAILSQYQRLSRYHLSRVGTAANYAGGLRKTAHAAQLAHILADLSNEESQAKRLALALRPGAASTGAQS